MPLRAGPGSTETVCVGFLASSLERNHLRSTAPRWRASNPAVGRSPSASCRRTSLNQPIYSTTASSSWARLARRGRRSARSSGCRRTQKVEAAVAPEEPFARGSDPSHRRPQRRTRRTSPATATTRASTDSSPAFRAATRPSRAGDASARRCSSAGTHSRRLPDRRPTARVRRDVRSDDHLSPRLPVCGRQVAAGVHPRRCARAGKRAGRIFVHPFKALDGLSELLRAPGPTAQTT